MLNDQAMASSSGMAGSSTSVPAVPFGKSVTAVLVSEPGNLSNFRASINMLKGMIGFGILTLPWATAQVGLIPSCIGMALVAVSTVAGIILSDVAKERLTEGEVDPLVRQQDKAGSEEEPLTPSETPVNGKKTEPWGSGLGFFDKVVAQVLGRSAQAICIASIIVLQFGTGVTYIVAVSQNLQTYLKMSPERAVLSIGVTYVVLSWFDGLRRVTYLSLAALCVFILVFVALVVEGSRNYHEHQPSMHLVKLDSPNYGAWFGICSFSFGGFPIANVIRNDMQHKEDFRWVMVVAFIICWAIYSTFAAVGYVFFGDAVEDIVYLSFPRSSVAFITSVVSLSIILSFTFVLQMTPIYMFTQQFVPNWPRQVVNSQIAALAAVTAYVMPNTIFVISTFGALGGELSGYIFPALVYLKLSSRSELGLQVLAVALLLLGFCGAGSAMLSALAPQS